jgi:hypothetical protein
MLDREDLDRLGQVRVIIAEMEAAIRAFETVIGKPMYIADGTSGRFKYPKPSPQVLIVLKTVRVVSGLNALTSLLQFGQTVEMAVIIRTVDDFLDEIMFVEEVVQTGKPTTDQQRFIDQFFAEDDFSVEQMTATDAKRPRGVPRKSIQASQGRVLGPFAHKGPDRVRRMAKTIDAAYSGHVHGSYMSAMELYQGGDGEGFMLRGTLGSPHIKTYLEEVARYVHRTLNTFAGIAHGFGLRVLAERLLRVRRSMEESASFRGVVV